MSLMEDNEIVVECGWNYPDKLYNKIADKAEEMDIYENLSICAESSGGNVLLTQRINGGPKSSYRKW